MKNQNILAHFKELSGMPRAPTGPSVQFVLREKQNRKDLTNRKSAVSQCSAPVSAHVFSMGNHFIRPNSGAL